MQEYLTYFIQAVTMHLACVGMVGIKAHGQLASLKPEAGWGHVNNYPYDASNLALAPSLRSR